MSEEGKILDPADAGCYAEIEKRAAAKAEANAAALPGPLKNAFDAEPIAVAGFTLEVPKASHMTVLDRIGSPLYKALFSDEEARKSLVASHEDIYEAIFVFTRPIAVVRAELRKGREAFREAACVAIADQCSPIEIPNLEAAVVKNLTDAISTWIGYEAKGPEDGTTFTKPPAEPMTGSVGG